ncbi:arginine utilization regulatory protein [Dethiosulfatibacter aminovorans DSM 17477]|uniref:Arginine utilization regulatory protein n=1 Tax=Dethiosulfatibacter aminovorans DSM 17477 TaxID=1121476 RepID=A0A1M6M3E2_9FIRM|nr:sigma 54-interacting transcriptional regulator [Dethiosulfatibacter aminovorans]SHJ77883.1 arginine utilization regulatory protein [Dethiosulfatibacter aminovorans DSM 17477]
MREPNRQIKTFLEKQKLPLSAIEAVEDICIHIVDKEGKTICYSKGCENIEGEKRENILGKTIDELYTFEKIKDNPHGSIQLKVLETGEIMKNNHVMYTSKNNRRLDVISSTYPVFSDNGEEVIAAVCVFRDIGDYMKMANTIQKLKSDLATEKMGKSNNGTVYTFKDVISQSKSMEECIYIAKKAARSTAPVMIIGSTGTGKEVFAQSIHNESIVSKGPFVAINCSAIPENLLESTLFGTCKGAFTGAMESTGLFETAKNGTLFLDEINSMSLSLQAKLLRALETKTIRKVGGNEVIPINVRIISATNQDPLDAVKSKQIRADFYYRLAVISLDLPALKDRKEDISILIDSFILNHSAVLGKQITQISDEAYNMLMEHDWPGNVRELKHVIDQALYLADFSETLIKAPHLPKYLYDNYSKKKHVSKYVEKQKDSLKETMKDIEKEIIMETFESCNKNITQTAEKLGMTRQNMQHKLKSYGIR